MSDLADKIRELVAVKRKWAEHIQQTCKADANQFRAGDVITFCDELEALLASSREVVLLKDIDEDESKLSALIGNVLTHWEQLSNDVKGELGPLNTALIALWNHMECK